MEQNLAIFLPLDTSETTPASRQFDFRTILRGIERHAQRVYAQPNGRADKLEQLANLLVGSATTLLASTGFDEMDLKVDERHWGENKVVYFPVQKEVQTEQQNTRDRHQLFLDWLFEQLESSATSIVQASATEQEAITQFSLFLEETASSLEEFANRFSSLVTDCDWSL